MSTSVLGADAELLVQAARSLSIAADEMRRRSSKVTTTLAPLGRTWSGAPLVTAASRWAETAVGDLLRRAQLADDLDSVRHLIEVDAIRAERAAMSAFARGDVDEARRWADRAELDRGLLAPRLTIGAWGTATFEERQFLVFDPVNGRVAEVFGDVGSASAVGVLVPGTTSNLGNFGLTADRARLMHAEASEVTCGEVATIAWLDYDAPDNLFQARYIDRAEAGGIRLAGFVHSLQATMPAGARVTLIGHSYGSDVVAMALLAGAPAHAAVLLGSPGVPVDHARDSTEPSPPRSTSCVPSATGSRTPIGTRSRPSRWGSSQGGGPSSTSSTLRRRPSSAWTPAFPASGPPGSTPASTRAIRRTSSRGVWPWPKWAP